MASTQSPLSPVYPFNDPSQPVSLYRGGIGGLAAGQEAAENLAGEAAFRRRLGQSARLDRWVDVWDNLRAGFARTDALNLDRKQAVLDAFFMLAAGFG